MVKFSGNGGGLWSKLVETAVVVVGFSGKWLALWSDLVETVAGCGRN